MASTKPNRAYPSLPSAGGGIAFLEALREAVEIHERRTNNKLDSFVRLGELVELGILAIQGDQVLSSSDTLFGVPSIFTLRGDATTPANTTYVRFEKSDTTSVGWVGDGGSADDNLTVKADLGFLDLRSDSFAVRLQPSGGDIKFGVGAVSWTDFARLSQSNVFTDSQPLRLAQDSAFISFYNTANSVRRGYLQMATGADAYLGSEESGRNLHLLTNGGTVILNSSARLKGYTVAGLPAGAIGDTAYVTDALAPVFGAAVAGGGAVMVPVYYTGAAWFVG